jgi:flagellar motor switch protein FliN/FliY
MTQQEITPREALIRLGASTGEAIAKVLEMFVPGTVQRGEVTVLADGVSPFANVARGSIATSVSYVDGVTGANVFVMTPAGARALAAAMGAAAEEVAEGADPSPLSELELSALSEAANQTMAAAAAAIGVVLGQGIEISTPDTRVLGDPAGAADIYGTAPHATSTTFMIAGESCRLIQLVPRAFVVRMVRAIDEESAERTDSTVGTGSAARAARSAVDSSPHSLALEEALGGISLRVWAELGRTRMPLGSALGLPVGAVVDLDRTADAPVDLYVNGMRFARGQLLVTDDGEWAVSLDGLDSQGLSMLDLARSAQAQPRELVEPAPEVVEPAAESSDIESEDRIEDRDPTSTAEPETPEVTQSEVEGAVT